MSASHALNAVEAFAVARAVDGRYRVEFPAGSVVYETAGYVSDVRVSPDGSLVAFVDHSIQGDDRGDVADRDLSWLDYSTCPRVSGDGKQLLFTEQGDGGGAEYSVYLRTTDGGPAVRLGPGIGCDISPDGKWVLSSRLAPAPSQLVLLPTGAGEAKVLTDDALTHEFGSFVDGGTRIVFEGFAPGRPKRLYLQDLSGGAPRPITPEGVAGLLSPDGTLVAFRGSVYEAGGGAARPIPGFDANDRIEGWSSDSRSVLTRQVLPSGGQHVFRIDVTTGKRTLLHDVAPVPGASPRAWFTITPDGSAYFSSYYSRRGDLFVATGWK
jgi:Tol biopolymer transport system component